MNLTYRLPGAGQTILPHSHSLHPHPHNGQMPRPPNPTVPLFPGNQGNQGPGTSRPAPKPRTRPPSYYRRNYRRAVIYRATKAVETLPPARPNSLRELAARSLDMNKCSKSTPVLTKKRKRASSSPPSFRKHLTEDFLLNEEVISDAESPSDHLEEILNTRSTELLRSPEETPDAILPETLKAGEERLEASLELGN